MLTIAHCTLPITIQMKKSSHMIKSNKAHIFSSINLFFKLFSTFFKFLSLSKAISSIATIFHKDIYKKEKTRVKPLPHSPW